MVRAVQSGSARWWLRLVVLLVVAMSACSGDTGAPSVPSLGPGVVPDGSQVTVPTASRASRGPMVRLSEVHYHAVDDDPGAEFVELTNVGDRAVQLEGWCVRGIGFCFSVAQTLEPGGFTVVRQDKAEGTLSNKGERIELVDALGQVVDAVAYDDGGVWPIEADGGGLSLQRSDFGNAGTSPDAWEAAMPTPGGPLVRDVIVPKPEVAISEVHYHPESGNPAESFVEVINVADRPVDLKGWCLRGAGYCWDTSTVLRPGAAVAAVGVFAEGDLSRSKDRIRVVDTDSRVHDTVVYEDRGEWPARADGDGSSLQRRNAVLSGAEPGNWEIGVPTPESGPTAVDRPLLPVFRDVSFELGPAPDEPLEITATVTDAESVTVEYVVGFGETSSLPATLDKGRVTAILPGQPAGSLVRFRLVASGAAGGSWPRAGDGSNFGGTVVRDADVRQSGVPRMQWFVEPSVWEKAQFDTRKHGNNGYPAVLALDGVVVDNVIIRIKGNLARNHVKKKWKVMLPAGHSFDAGGRIDPAVDQFDLLNSGSDKSYSRELLVHDMQLLSGGLSQQVFPLQLDVNGGFLGLYMYGESPEGTWRDRHGFSDSVYVWKADWYARLLRNDADLSEAELRRRYERVTLRYLEDNDEPLRELIRTINTLEGERLVAWAEKHLDIPQMVEAIATMRIVQHADWVQKNFLLVFDPADSRWRLVPIDFDLTLGRLWGEQCRWYCDAISAQSWLEYPSQNRFARIILRNEPFRSMVDRRTRELSEVYLAEGRMESRLKELNDLLGDLAERDRRTWGSFGTRQTMKQAQRVMIEDYVEPKRWMYIGAGSRLPGRQPSRPQLDVEVLKRGNSGQVEEARITNNEETAIDISNREFPEIAGLVPAGTVIPAGESVFVTFARTPAPDGTSGDWWVRARRLPER